MAAISVLQYLLVILAAVGDVAVAVVVGRHAAGVGPVPEVGRARLIPIARAAVLVLDRPSALP